jgi:hypothetical protein
MVEIATYLRRRGEHEPTGQELHDAGIDLNRIEHGDSEQPDA